MQHEPQLIALAGGPHTHDIRSERSPSSPGSTESLDSMSAAPIAKCARAIRSRSPTSDFRARLLRVLGACAVLSFALLGGCAVRRELVIYSDPPGAILRVDETIVGTTPYRHAFEDYGSRRITLSRNGYHTVSQVVSVSPPWYAHFPLDFISEIVFAFGWRDTHEFNFQLEPDSGAIAEPDILPVLEQAERLRHAGPEGPQPPKPPKPPD